MKRIRGILATFSCFLVVLSTSVAVFATEEISVTEEKSYASFTEDVLSSNLVEMNVDLGVISASLPFKYKEPSQDVKFFSPISFQYVLDEGGSKIYILDTVSGKCQISTATDGDMYKYVIYDSATGKFYSNVNSYVDVGENTVANFDLVEAISPEAAIAGATVVCTGECLTTFTTDTCYILALKSDATSLKDIVYTFKYTNVVTHIKEYSPLNLETQIDNSKNKVTVEVLEKFEGSKFTIKSAKFLINWNIVSPFPDDFTYLITVNDETWAVLNQPLKGSYELTINELENKPYKFEVLSRKGCRATYTYNVDFCKLEDTTVVPLGITPIVTFNEIPENPVYEGENIILKMNTDNVPTIMRFDGATLGNGVYGNSFEFTVSKNGEYYYDATTKDGLYTSGVFDITFFKESSAEDDPINKDLNIPVEDKLTQTGTDYNTSLIGLGIVLIVLGSVILIARKFKGGAKHEN